MKVVTLRQPDATAVVLGRKTRLNRGRRIAYRGPLLIHAASEEPSPRALEKAADLDPAALPYGAIIGIVEVIGCVPNGDGCSYEWFLADARPLPQPYPCKGRWGLWSPPAELTLV